MNIEFCIIDFLKDYSIIFSSLTALAGLIMGFLSVKLSVVAIRETHKVQKEVTLQKFKIKQQEEVASLIAKINGFKFYLDFRDHGFTTPKYVAFNSVNLLGILEINKEIKENYPDFLIV